MRLRIDRAREQTSPRPRTRRLRRAGILLAVGAFGAGLPAGSAGARGGGARLECPAGRYLVSTGPLLESPDTDDVIEIGDGRVSIGDRCPPVRVRVKRSRDGWVLRAVWRRCDGLRGRARLQAKLDKGCAGLAGRFVARRARVRHFFAARRATCDDGILDDRIVDDEDEEQCEVERSRIVGLRFPGVPVPAGAAVRAAYVQFRAATPGAGAAALEVAGEASDVAAPFSAAPHDVSARPRTATIVSWSPPSWDAPGEAGPEHRTPDLAAVIQEIVDRPGWVRGNAVALIVTGAGQRVAVAYDGAPEAAPLLHVEYAEAMRTSTTTTVTSTTATATTSSTLPTGGLSVEIRIAASADDAEEDVSGAVVVIGPQLVLGRTPVAPVSFSQVVHPIFAARCASAACHGGAQPQQQLDLSERAVHRRLVDVPSTECPETKLVVPGAPEASYLVAKLRGGGPCFLGDRMPPAAPLSRSNLATIMNWIAQGAADD